MHHNTMPTFPDDIALAMAYIPWQELQDVYEPETALKNGILFPELNKPFKAGGRSCG